MVRILLDLCLPSLRVEADIDTSMEAEVMNLMMIQLGLRGVDTQAWKKDLENPALVEHLVEVDPYTMKHGTEKMVATRLAKAVIEWKWKARECGRSKESIGTIWPVVWCLRVPLTVSSQRKSALILPFLGLYPGLSQSASVHVVMVRVVWRDHCPPGCCVSSFYEDFFVFLHSSFDLFLSVRGLTLQRSDS